MKVRKQWFAWSRKKKDSSIADGADYLEHVMHSNTPIEESYYHEVSSEVIPKVFRYDGAIPQQHSNKGSFPRQNEPTNSISTSLCDTGSVTSSFSTSSSAQRSAADSVARSHASSTRCDGAEQNWRSGGKQVHEHFCGTVGALQIKTKLAHAHSSLKMPPTKEEVQREMEMLSGAFTAALNDSVLVAALHVSSSSSSQLPELLASHSSSADERMPRAQSEMDARRRRRGGQKAREETDEERWARVFARFDDASAALDRALAAVRT